MELIGIKEQVARKIHECEVCGRWIYKGKKYIRKCFKDADGVVAIRLCGRCDQVEDEHRFRGYPDSIDDHISSMVEEVDREDRIDAAEARADAMREERMLGNF